MAHEMLMKFLKLGLIDLGGSDERLEKLIQTSAEIASVLKKNPGKSIAYSLVALDPNVPEGDPVVAEVVAVLGIKWPTYPNAFPSTPITLVRAILFDALLAAADTDDDIAVAFACITRNMMPYVKAGAEQTVWTDAVQNVERDVDERASEEWTTPASIGVGTLTIPSDTAEVGGKISKKAVARDTLKARVVGAFFATNQGGQNPQHIQNNPGAWAQNAAPLLSEGIADGIDEALKGVQFTGGDISGPFEALAGSVTKYIEAVAQSVALAAGGLERRTNLLWWREALHSPSARVSYRDLTTTSAAALMALDVSNLVPVFSPSSVTAFIKEAVRALGSADERKTIKALIEELRSTRELEALRSAAKVLAPSMAGRGPLLAVIAQPEGALPDEPAFVAAVGVSYATELRSTDWASWIYSELQAIKAVQKPRKSRKSS